MGALIERLGDAVYKIDLVLCVDCTGSMGPVLGMVKDHAAHIHEDIAEYMSYQRKPLSGLRARVVAFRDYYAAGAPAMLESRFFDLPGEAAAFREFVALLHASEGGNEPEESGLEALALAIRSPWALDADRSRRQVIVVWTDDAAHRLERADFRTPAHAYPRERVPQSLNELTDWWNTTDYIDPAGRRLLLFAPAVYPWREIAAQWEETVWFPSRAGAGISDHEYTSVIAAIAQSVMANVA